MVKRLISLLLVGWLLGFAWFAAVLPQPLSGGKTDAVIVLTGGEGRVARGLEVLRKGWAGNLLVSGVDREVRPREFVAAYGIAPAQMAVSHSGIGVTSAEGSGFSRCTEAWTSVMSALSR